MTIGRNHGVSLRAKKAPVQLEPLRHPVTVAVIIPAHNEESTIAETVRSCLRQTHPVEQLIVVADNCTDATADRAFEAGAIVIEGDGGCKAAAQNLALPKVSADVVLALDGDATLGPSSVAAMVDTISAGRAGTCPAAVPKDIDTIYSQYRTLYHAIANGWMRKMQDLLGRQLVLSGMANCHRTDILQELGGFPEDNITEDFNLTWMLHHHGFPVAFTSDATVYTQEPTSLRELFSQTHRWTSGFAQSVVDHRSPFLDAGSFVVIGAQLTDAVIGGLATCSFVPFLLRHGIAGLWRWWAPLWVAVTVVSLVVAVQQVGSRTTLRCLPGWFVLQIVTGPAGVWWLFREFVLGRHLTSWTGRHGCAAKLTPMSRRRKMIVGVGAAVAMAAGAALASHRRTFPRSAPVLAKKGQWCLSRAVRALGRAFGKLRR